MDGMNEWVDRMGGLLLLPVRGGSTLGNYLARASLI